MKKPKAFSSPRVGRKIFGPWRPARPAIYRALELWYLPGALQADPEEWSASGNEGLRDIGAHLEWARWADEFHRAQLEALVADLAARLRSS